jgi:hypothetical protein
MNVLPEEAPSQARRIVPVTELKPYIGWRVTVGDRTGCLVDVRQPARRNGFYFIRFADARDTPLRVPSVVSAVVEGTARLR